VSYGDRRVPLAGRVRQRPLQLQPLYQISVSVFYSIKVTFFARHFLAPRCQCDRQLSRCLHAVKTRVSNALGKMFFNIVGM